MEKKVKNQDKEKNESKEKNLYFLVPFTFQSEIGRFYCYFSKKGLFQMLLEENLVVKDFEKKGIRICNLKNIPKEIGEFSKINFEILKDELTRYFKRQIVNFTSPIDMSFYTDFQKKVLNQLIKIPFGKVVSYKEVAEKIGNPKAFRAVGSAVGSNRTLILIPCHRVIKNDGSIGWFGGYGNGKELKKRILSFEGLNIRG
jgi:O-6-methylguanine DNA methyltransferase